MHDRLAYADKPTTHLSEKKPPQVSQQLEDDTSEPPVTGHRLEEGHARSVQGLVQPSFHSICIVATKRSIFEVEIATAEDTETYALQYPITQEQLLQ